MIMRTRAERKYCLLAVFACDANMRPVRVCALAHTFSVKCIHRIVMIMKAEPSSGHIAGEAGGILRNKISTLV